MEGIKLLKRNVQKTFDNIFVAGAFIFLLTHLQSQLLWLLFCDVLLEKLPFCHISI